MAEGTETREALGRAGRRVAYHLLQALIESLKAVEAVIDEIGKISESPDDAHLSRRTKIEVE